LLQDNRYGSLEAICLWDFIRRAALFNFFYVTQFRQANYVIGFTQLGGLGQMEVDAMGAIWGN